MPETKMIPVFNEISSNATFLTIYPRHQILPCCEEVLYTLWWFKNQGVFFRVVYDFELPLASTISGNYVKLEDDLNTYMTAAWKELENKLPHITNIDETIKKILHNAEQHMSPEETPIPYIILLTHITPEILAGAINATIENKTIKTWKPITPQDINIWNDMYEENLIVSKLPMYGKPNTEFSDEYLELAPIYPYIPPKTNYFWKKEQHVLKLPLFSDATNPKTFLFDTLTTNHQ